MDGAFLEIIIFNMTLDVGETQKLCKISSLSLEFLSVVTNHCLDLKCNAFFANSFTHLKIDVDYI